MIKVKYKLSITVQAPVLSHSSDTMAFGYDMAMRKYQKKPVLNGSLIRGNIRHNLEYFVKKLSDEKVLSINDIDRWFGKESKNNMQPNRALINFDYFWKLNASYKPNDVVPRYRIGISDKTETVDQGNLQVIESVFKVGKTPEFEGYISAWISKDDTEDKLEKWLNKAMQYMSAIGALKGNGFGKVIGYKLEKLSDENTNKVLRFNGKPKSIEYAFTLDRPLCVAKAHIPNSNRFVSEEYITGSILKASFSRLIEKLEAEKSDLKDKLDKIRFTHAMPVGEKESPYANPVPLSLAVAGDRVIDMVLQKEACLLKINNKKIAPTFSPDWKYLDRKLVYERVNKQDVGYHLPAETHRLLTVRTKINKLTSAADEGHLFSFECIDNFQKKSETKKMAWKARVDCSDGESEVKEVIDKLIQYGLEDIGKTKAQLDIVDAIENGNSESQFKPLKTDKNEIYVVLLKTDARILPANHGVKPTNDAETLHQKYSEYFSHISDKKLELSHFYAQQKLHGGAFYHDRYRSTEPYSYTPEWITVAGSVFVLQKSAEKNHSESDIETLLKSWVDHGLPVALDREQDTWETDPFRPENGFGEIIVNHEIHSKLSKPDGIEFITLDKNGLLDKEVTQ